MHISIILVLDSNAAKFVTAELTNRKVNFRGIVLYGIVMFLYFRALTVTRVPEVTTKTQ